VFIEVATKALKRHDKILRKEMACEEYTCEKLEKFEPSSKMARDAKLGYLTGIKLIGIDPEESNTNTLSDLEEYIQGKKPLLNQKKHHR
jgi:cell wall-associated protease